MKKILSILACISICAVGCNQKTTQEELKIQNNIETDADYADVQHCQSCCMPLSEELCGTNADGSPNNDYCKYCYENGSFTVPDVTMNQMIEICVPYMVQQGMSEVDARQILEQFMPTLKRWKTQ